LLGGDTEKFKAWQAEEKVKAKARKEAWKEKQPTTQTLVQKLKDPSTYEAKLKVLWDSKFKDVPGMRMFLPAETKNLPADFEEFLALDETARFNLGGVLEKCTTTFATVRLQLSKLGLGSEKKEGLGL